MKFLKPVFLVFFSLLFFQNVNAQFNVGAGLGYGEDISELSVFVRAEYQFNETWRGAATFNYFFLEDIPDVDVGYSTVNADVHYIFADKEKLQAYALGGLNLAFVNVGIDLGTFGSINETVTEVGVNLGAGARLKAGEKFSPLLEAKYVVGEASQLVLMLGAVFAL